jgi:hypothetical protein
MRFTTDFRLLAEDAISTSSAKTTADTLAIEPRLTV